MFDKDMSTSTAIAIARAWPGYAYLASPYTKYPSGINEANACICVIAADLMRLGVSLFSPIAHSHAVAIYGGLDPLDYKIWLPSNEPLIAGAYGMIVAKMDTWETSYGINLEIEAFERAGKPIVAIDPLDL